MNILRLSNEGKEATIVQHSDRVAFSIAINGVATATEEQKTSTATENEVAFTSILKSLLNDSFVITELIASK